jgi:multidrug resistance efflux pump
MDLLLILIYVSFCYAIFKIFRIPVNQWSLATATLGGIVGIALLLLTMNYNHPFTNNARIYYAITEVLPEVRGRVIEVPVTPNMTLKQGDVLFRMDATVYKANVAVAEASVREANANRDRAKEAYERFERGNITKSKNMPFSEIDVANRRGIYLAAQAALENAEAKLVTAKYELECTTVRAPGDGFVTQVTLRPGQLVVPMPFRPVMVFVNRGMHDQALVAAFQQNSLQRVKEGDDAEVAFDAVPGRVFKGKVRLVPDVIAAGQWQATGRLLDFGERVPGGRIPAVIDIIDDLSAYQIPLGSAAQVAILTHHMHHLSLIRRVLLRMMSWENFIFTE